MSIGEQLSDLVELQDEITHLVEGGNPAHTYTLTKKQNERRQLIDGIVSDYNTLLECVIGIAGESCCETEGCTVEDPMCDVMKARAALVEIGYKGSLKGSQKGSEL